MEGALEISLEDTNFDIIISRKVNMLYVPQKGKDLPSIAKRIKLRMFNQHDNFHLECEPKI